MPSPTAPSCLCLQAQHCLNDSTTKRMRKHCGWCSGKHVCSARNCNAASGRGYENVVGTKLQALHQIRRTRIKRSLGISVNPPEALGAPAGADEAPELLVVAGLACVASAWGLLLNGNR